MSEHRCCWHAYRRVDLEGEPEPSEQRRWAFCCEKGCKNLRVQSWDGIEEKTHGVLPGQLEAPVVRVR